MKTTSKSLLSTLIICCGFGVGFMAPAAIAKKPDTLVVDGYDQKAMDAAITRARSEIESFKKELFKDDAESYSVKAPISDRGQTEHFWLNDVTFKDGTFSGVIANQPGVVRNVKMGQKWQIKQSEISDWMYTRGEKIHGGYTIDPLLVTMGKDQAQAMRARLVR
jgi:uncharacterized protein YegJ (DUF2314 family)